MISSSYSYVGCLVYRASAFCFYAQSNVLPHQGVEWPFRAILKSEVARVLARHALHTRCLATFFECGPNDVRANKLVGPVEHLLGHLPFEARADIVDFALQHSVANASRLSLLACPCGCPKETCPPESLPDLLSHRAV